MMDNAMMIIKSLFGEFLNTCCKSQIFILTFRLQYLEKRSFINATNEDGSVLSFIQIKLNAKLIKAILGLALSLRFASCFLHICIFK